MAAESRQRPFVGLQVQPFSFYDEGIERVLDHATLAGTNALFIYTHLFAAGLDAPLDTLAPDHGIAPRDPKTRKPRRVWVRHTPGLFDDLPARFEGDVDADHAGRDLFAEIAGPCRSQGMKVFGRMLLPHRDAIGGQQPNRNWAGGRIEGWDAMQQIDADGRPGYDSCLNNPLTRELWSRAAGDAVKSAGLDGFMIGVERPGPISDVLQSSRGFACFCEHCIARMKRVGVDAERARVGGRELTRWRDACLASEKVRDGALGGLLRLFVQFPELLAIEREWALAFDEFVARVGKAVKAARPGAIFGRHIDHQQTSWDLFYRAASDYSRIAADVDFLKPVAYHEIMGPRTKLWIVDRWRKTLARDLSDAQTLDIFYALTGADPTKEPRLAELMTRGFSTDYVARETRRCVKAVGEKCAVYPGIASDVPAHMPDPPSPRRLFDSDPASITAAVKAAFEAGARGIIACREYQEMRLPNLRAFGRGVAEAATTVFK